MLAALRDNLTSRAGGREVIEALNVVQQCQKHKRVLEDAALELHPALLLVIQDATTQATQHMEDLLVDIICEAAHAIVVSCQEANGKMDLQPRYAQLLGSMVANHLRLAMAEQLHQQARAEIYPQPKIMQQSVICSTASRPNKEFRYFQFPNKDKPTIPTVFEALSVTQRRHDTTTGNDDKISNHWLRVATSSTRLLVAIIDALDDSEQEGLVVALGDALQRSLVLPDVATKDFCFLQSVVLMGSTLLHLNSVTMTKDMLQNLIKFSTKFLQKVLHSSDCTTNSLAALSIGRWCAGNLLAFKKVDVFTRSQFTRIAAAILSQLCKISPHHAGVCMITQMLREFSDHLALSGMDRWTLPFILEAACHAPNHSDRAHLWHVYNKLATMAS